ncbi:hypothetical protein M413DRAFT_448239 [Hebeloma cylindrosporum]|uniref:Uncharacterized protein n=1 Tax=Hebeloma cylindrosporum TaxID=76867 RepID=A0A0C3BLY5_HEBCY|nr:hypothetical protein M413DRAFT_448239 [Hebeloma cylindrosporum h7]
MIILLLDRTPPTRVLTVQPLALINVPFTLLDLPPCVNGKWSRPFRNPPQKADIR